jgi:4-amino-4-deoxy-L-arabinose transferase-like glycosyltransferase
MARAAHACAVLLAAACLGYYGLVLLEQDPPVWPDEALFADAALHLLQDGEMRTELMAGLLPGIERRTYWIPPLHPLGLTAVFALFGPGVVPMRSLSLFAALVVLLLTAALAQRIGLGRIGGAAAALLLATDVVFLRGARIGRMDVLCLVFILAALWFASRPTPAGRASGPDRTPLWAGMASGLALLSHPAGAVAPASVALAYALWPAAPRRRLLGGFALGFGLVLLAWTLYALADPTSFLAQMHLQFQRKGASSPLAWTSLVETLRMSFDQYQGAGLAGRVAWLVGGVGLLLGGLRRERRVVLVAAAATLAVLLVGREIWYPVYLVPFVALGLAVPFAEAARLPSRWKLVLAAPLLLGAWIAQQNLAYERWLARRPATDYTSYCRDISAALPEGARVLVAAIPDPYFGLVARDDLELRSFVPLGMPVDRAAERAVLEASDYVVTGARTPSKAVRELVRRRGVPVARIQQGYFAAVYRIVGAQRAEGERSP